MRPQIELRDDQAKRRLVSPQPAQDVINRRYWDSTDAPI
jgi:hypothetical protein